MKHSVHRVNSRLTEDVLIPVRRYLIKNAPYIKHSIAIGDGHICDRIAERTTDINKSVDNVKFIFMKMLEDHLCELVYLALSTEKTAKIAGVYKTSDTNGILFGFTIKKLPLFDSVKLVWKFSTYIPDLKMRERPDYEMFYLN